MNIIVMNVRFVDEHNCTISRGDIKFNIPLSQNAFCNAYTEWEDGKLIQEAFPTLDAGIREWIKTGITPEQWDKIFNEASGE